MVEDSGNQERSDETADVEADDTDGLFDPAVEALEADQIDDPIVRLELQLAEAIESAASYKDQLYRKAAELENTKRRLNKQMEEIRTFGTLDVLRELLPVIDDLDRAIEHAQKETQGDGGSAGDSAVGGMIDGIGMVAKKFLATLERFGLKAFDSVGQEFDPQMHEAINQMETSDYPDGTVMTEFLKGYMLHDRLIRPAVVVVARNPSESE